MTDERAKNVLSVLRDDEAQPRYCSDAGAYDLHRLNVEALKHALQAIEDRAALVDFMAVHVYGSKPSPAVEAFTAARRHMHGED